MIYGAQHNSKRHTPERRDHSPEVLAAKDHLEAACNAYVDEPCSPLLEDVRLAFRDAQSLSPELLWDKWLERNYPGLVAKVVNS